MGIVKVLLFIFKIHYCTFISVIFTLKKPLPILTMILKKISTSDLKTTDVYSKVESPGSGFAKFLEREAERNPTQPNLT